VGDDLHGSRNFPDAVLHHWLHGMPVRFHGFMSTNPFSLWSPGSPVLVSTLPGSSSRSRWEICLAGTVQTQRSQLGPLIIASYNSGRPVHLCRYVIVIVRVFFERTYATERILTPFFLPLRSSTRAREVDSTDVKLQFGRSMAVVVPKMCLYQNAPCSATRLSVA
jgi:hypothetical protein